MNNDRINSPIYRSRRRVSGISWRLFGMLTLFVVLILIVIWTFQVALLNRFYESSKLDEFHQTDEEIFSATENIELLQRITYKRSIGTDSCIRVFKITDGVPSEIADCDANINCFIHHADGAEIRRLCTGVLEKDGNYTRRISNSVGGSTVIVTIHAAASKGADGSNYVILQESALLPLSATVTTLEHQFGWIMCILIMGALVMALLLSRLICLPMERMSRSARRLAKGEYDAHFFGGGYREAEELAEALNYAASELAKNDNLQKELVANISHDLRTPLTMIKGYGEVMRDIPGESTPENMQVIIDETERLTELVNDMLDLSKIRAGTRKPELEIFDLTEVIGAVMLRYEKFTEQQEYSITFEKEENISVNADRTMILQVVYNLVNNALNYTGEDKKVQIKQTVEGGRVRVSVTDTGVGIAPEDIPYIWDRYYKVDKVHKRAVVGTGLGLSIVKGILESHGARYGVESVIDKGSTFWFELDAIYDSSFEEEN
ncbi:MAG: HAMP domain-containing histidine kinase [Clostridia bacterium]|nr:HAMP domain-containing histidine kinase [Clostridia bacterium]